MCSYSIKSLSKNQIWLSGKISNPVCISLNGEMDKNGYNFFPVCHWRDRKCWKLLKIRCQGWKEDIVEAADFKILMCVIKKVCHRNAPMLYSQLMINSKIVWKNKCQIKNGIFTDNFTRLEKILDNSSGIILWVRHWMRTRH